MSISRLKLLNYLKILRKHIPGNTTDELHQAMDGIEEVGTLHTAALCLIDRSTIHIFTSTNRIAVVLAAKNRFQSALLKTLASGTCIWSERRSDETAQTIRIDPVESIVCGPNPRNDRSRRKSIV